jgi:anti-sigma factor RsiW
MTSCAETRELLSAYVDGELPPDRAAAVADHLASCAACAGEYEATLATVRRVREGLVRHRAPDVLRARIRAALREEEQHPHEPRPDDDAAPAAGPPRVARRRPPWRLTAAAAAAAVVIAAASSGITLVATTGRGAPSAPPVGEEVLASHVRSLMPEHLTDVRSNDTHNVKPWFNGRLDYSPSVPRLEDEGFPLLGGRLDYVHGRPVAVVVYGRRQHVINAFSWPSDSARDAAESRQTRHGYNLLHWRRGGVEHWVASDLNADELRQFAALLRAAEAGPAPLPPPRS